MTSLRDRPVVRALGAVALALLLAANVGGQAALGRIDPALALPVLPLAALFLAWLQRRSAAPARWRGILLAAAILLSAQATLALFLSPRPPWLQLGLVAVAWVIAAGAADCPVHWRRRRVTGWLLSILFVAGWFVGGHALLAALYRAPAAHGVPATMITGLPLRWSAGSDIAAMIVEGTNEDPALLALEAAGPLRLVDSIVDQPPAPGGALLVAHPRALAPQELVAIDAFVRGGGRAVILADALTSWPIRHPVGDPRNPPITSLLTPLLDHWGVGLGAVPDGDRQAVVVDVDGARLAMFSVGRFERLPTGCRAHGGRRVAHCRIGRGEAWLVGDADLLFAPLWQSSRPSASHWRRADTIEWLAAQLWPDAPQAMLQPLWIRPAAE